MQVIPLAADSMGVRSMATFVETKDVSFLIDPAAVLAGRRHGLAPHALETACLGKLRERIELYAKTAKIIVLTRYHEEHFSPDLLEKCRDKILLIKNPNVNVRPERRTLAFETVKTVRGLASEIAFADGRTFTFGKTEIAFSDCIASGQTDSGGDAISLAVREEEETFCFSSRTRGVYPDETATFLSSRRPSLLYLDGPVTHETDGSAVKVPPGASFKRIKKIILDSGASRVIIDHHLLRDPNWRRRAEPLYQIASDRDVAIQTAAEFRGEENLELEAGRKRLYELHPGGRVVP